MLDYRDRGTKGLHATPIQESQGILHFKTLNSNCLLEPSNTSDVIDVSNREEVAVSRSERDDSFLQPIGFVFEVPPVSGARFIAGQGADQGESRHLGLRPATSNRIPTRRVSRWQGSRSMSRWPNSPGRSRFESERFRPSREPSAARTEPLPPNGIFRPFSAAMYVIHGNQRQEREGDLSCQSTAIGVSSERSCNQR
jgi:hypothetical protein